MERVTGIGGVFFKTQDPKAMMAWYEAHLGIQPGGPGEMHAMFPWRDHQDPQVEGATVWSLFPHDTKYFGTGPALFMINYRVADLDALLAQLRLEGVAVEDRIEESYGRFAWITDPEGNRIELWEPPKETTEPTEPTNGEQTP